MILWKVLLPILTGVVALFGDKAVNVTEHNLTKALFDNVTHAIIGSLVWTTVCLELKIAIILYRGIWQILLCGCISSLIDFDHFISAKSLSLQDVQMLKSRPFLHNTALSLTFAASIFGLYLYNRSEICYDLFWIVFVAFISHHLRDAYRRGLWLYPLPSIPPINYWCYIILTLILPYVVTFGYKSLKHKELNLVYDRVETSEFVV